VEQRAERETIDISDGEAIGPRPPLSAVFGGGGVFGIAYNSGVAHALIDAGIALDRAPMLGTSAGSWCAAGIACGLGYDEFAALDAPRVPNLRRGLLAGIAREVFGTRTDPRVRASAIAVPPGRHHVLDGGRMPLADLCAASSAVPGLFAPHVIGGVRHVDGGVRSAINLDAAIVGDLVIVVAPIGGPVLGVAGRIAERMARRELTAWSARHAGDSKVRMCRPNHTIAAMAGRNPLNLFDADRAREVYPAAYEQGTRFARRLQAEGLAVAAPTPAAA